LASRRLRQSEEIIMTNFYWFGAIAIALLIYLVYALLKPERF
jgi:K+-transporting ATPase KdpF subunit